jgi:hypothetical protein
MPARASTRLALALSLAAAAGPACSRGADAEARRRVLSPEGEAPAAPAAWPRPDLADPAAVRSLLALDAGEAARRLGSFDWSGTAAFTVTRQGDSSARVHVEERHQVRQLAGGDFEVESEIDAGQGPGAVQGKRVVFAGGMTYAAARFAPFRERPTDRGRDARRFRDESFNLLADLARLYGPALALTPTGDVTLLGRAAKKYVVSLAPAAPASTAVVEARVFPANGPDADSRRHLAFLDGRVPVAAAGEVLLDVETGVPLRARLTGAFSVRDDARVRVQVEAAGQVKALGGKVGAVAAPKGALPDSRRPPGVAAALEAAGLKAHEKKGEKAEPADEPEP